MKSKSYFNITPITFKLKCLLDIEAAITVPEKGFFVRNRDSMRLCYSIGTTLKYIYLTTPEEAARFLHKHGLIDSFAFCNNEIKLYVKTLITITGDKGQPVQMERLLPVHWEDITLNQVQVLSFAAIHEYETKGKTMGIVVNMINDFLKTA